MHKQSIYTSELSRRPNKTLANIVRIDFLCTSQMRDVCMPNFAPRYYLLWTLKKHVPPEN